MISLTASREKKGEWKSLRVDKNELRFEALNWIREEPTSPPILLLVRVSTLYLFFRSSREFRELRLRACETGLETTKWLAHILHNLSQSRGMRFE